ncbi:MAG: ATP-binding protein [Porticoccaceae bacterium]|nr:ATP-binding protein [Porticoccaceae bacterium]
MSYLDQAKKAHPQAPVITIVGFPGVGKSTLAATFPNPIFVQAENATSVFETWPEDKQPAFFPELPSANQKRNAKPSEILLEQLRELATQDHPYKTVVIDAVTTLNMLFESEVIEFDGNPEATNIGEAAGGYGKGYLAVANLHAKVRSACEHLRRRGIAVVFLAHSGIAKVKNRPDVEAYATWTMDMHEASRRVYIATSDAVLYLKSREFVMGSDKDKKGNVKAYGKMTSTGERLLVTASEGTIGFVDAKNRYRIPQELDVAEGENPILPYIPFFNATQPPPVSSDTSEATEEE